LLSTVIHGRFEKHSVSPDDVVVIQAGIKHWHDATANSKMFHASIKMQGF